LFLSVGVSERRRRRRKNPFSKKTQPFFFHTLFQVISEQTSARVAPSSKELRGSVENNYHHYDHFQTSFWKNNRNKLKFRGLSFSLRKNTRCSPAKISLERFVVCSDL